jgi:hypothetical protein
LSKNKSFTAAAVQPSLLQNSFSYSQQELAE